MKLTELLDEMNYQFIQGHLDEEVSQIDYDSRTVPVSYTHLDVYKRQ